MDTVSLGGIRVLVSGAGVAGPALAYWLGRFGADATVVEIAPAPRTSGFRVDFRGATQLGVLEQMGILDQLRAAATHGGAMRFVDRDGREVFELPSDFAGGDIEVHRADLSRILIDASRKWTDYRFGDTVMGAEQDGEGVDVSFRSGRCERFDLVVGADGVHSTIRRLVFGPESKYVRQMGHVIAGWELPNRGGFGITTDHYGEPGRMLSVGADLRDPDRALAQVIFACRKVALDWHDTEAQRALIRDAFTGMAWRAPEVLPALDGAADLYFDPISRVQVPVWSQGRVALLGDAGWGVTLGGMGVGTGVVGAYVLAGELARAAGDPVPALSAYESVMRNRVAGWQRASNPGAFLAPKTRGGLWLRNWLLSSRRVQRWLVSTTKDLATDETLPSYNIPGDASRADGGAVSRLAGRR